MTLVEMKFAGRYKIKSAYLAIYIMAGVMSSYMLSMIILLVLIDACTTPVAADVKKYVKRTIHLY